MALDPFFTSKVRLKHSFWNTPRQTPIGGKKRVEELYDSDKRRIERMVQSKNKRKKF